MPERLQHAAWQGKYSNIYDSQNDFASSKENPQVNKLDCQALLRMESF
jgi:hypothetical protein